MLLRVKRNGRIHQYREISAHLLYSGVEILSHLRHPGDAEAAPGFSGRGARVCRKDSATDGQVQVCALSQQLWAQHRAAVRFNWRAGLPLKRRQPMRVGAHSGPANQSKRLLPSLRVASAGRLRRQLSSTLTSVQPAAT